MRGRRGGAGGGEGRERGEGGKRGGDKEGGAGEGEEADWIIISITLHLQNPRTSSTSL